MLKRDITKNPATGLYEYIFELAPTYTPEGKKIRHRKSVRRKNKKELIAEVTRLEKQLLEHGELIIASMTVKHWFDRWLEDAAKEKRPNTMTNYRSVVKTHIIPALGPNTKLDKIGADKIRHVYKLMGDKGLSSTYMLNAHRIMSSSFQDALRERKINVNPTTLVKPPRKALVTLDVLNTDEARELLRYVSEIPGGARWAVSLLTGLRRGEAVGLEWDRVGDMIDLSWQMQRLTYTHGCKPHCGRKRGADCNESFFEIPVGYEARQVAGGLHLVRPKSSSGWRIIPLVEPLRSIMERYIAASPPHANGLVFTHGDGRAIDPDQDTKAWNKVLQDVFPGRQVRLHDLRHTAVDLMLEAGVAEDVILEIFGWSARIMARSYKSKGNKKRLTGGMDKMAALIGGVSK
ncbi:tyrosine-type recombinase/integrase [Microbacterium sp. LWH12-1.2]|uniref:tyrosine-type recombinase/integrase n=1 Tax=Microbacterium sp. LWH12-1.2 TaxID=3135259 RepID=UPI0034215879